MKRERLARQLAMLATYGAVLWAVPGCESPAGPPPAVSAVPARASGPSSGGNQQRVTIRASKKGFEPNPVTFEAGRPGVLVFERIDDTECVNAVRMPWMTTAVDLPKGKPVEIPVDTRKPGKFVYSCWMNMMFGRVEIVEPAGN